MRKIIHLIPYDGVGGVEEAARSLGSFRDADMDFELRYLFPHVTSAKDRKKTNAPLAILRSGIRLAKENPDLVIVSLWRAVAAGLVAKVLNPRLKLVLFVHNARDSHTLDRLVTRLGLRICAEVWGDSAASVETRFSGRPRKPVRVVSYLVRKLDPLPPAPLAPNFAFWGRLSRQKNLPRALRFFHHVRHAYPDARFTLIGPNGDDTDAVHSEIQTLGLGNHVDVLAARPFDTIPPLLRQLGCCFYLQTSHYEGMSLSVTEAMQLGLVPVVTPVGEIARYATAGNAVLLDPSDESSDMQTVTQIADLLHTPGAYETRRSAAITAWTQSTTYDISMRDTLRKSLSIPEL